jgi:hypothetical protein
MSVSWAVLNLPRGHWTRTARRHALQNWAEIGWVSRRFTAVAKRGLLFDRHAVEDVTPSVLKRVDRLNTVVQTRDVCLHLSKRGLIDYPGSWIGPIRLEARGSRNFLECVMRQNPKRLPPPWPTIPSLHGGSFR